MRSQRGPQPAPTILLDGLAMGESPRWHDGRLFLSDWGAREIVAVNPDGRRATILEMDTAPFSIDWLPDGRLLVISRDGRLAAREADGTLHALADLSALSPHPWNEIVVDGRGNIYLNGIGFDFPGGEFAPGLIALVTPDGAVRQVADGVAFPNGMAVTPDNRTLILGESYGECLTAWDIGPDGDLSNRRTWASTPGDHPDGICLDTDGAAWYADVGAHHCVRVREGGEVLDTIETDRGCFACMLGGPDGRTLYIVAADWSDPARLFSGQTQTGRVLTARAPAPRAGWP
jgi:sugar lactone lactonase YvrE